MTEPPASTPPALLPVGFADLLPPDAESEAQAIGRLMQVFAMHGYQRVKPPLAEFEETLLAGTGAALAEQIFRVIDPDSQRMIGVRADTTPQIARIAATRLAGAPRPLRLAYSGQCLRVRGASGISAERQVGQAGVELFGPDSPAADAETVLVGVEALEAVGLDRFSIDLTMPTFVPALLDDAGIVGARRAALARDLDRKDAAAVAADGGPLAELLSRLLLAAGPVERALAALTALPLSHRARPLAERLAGVVTRLRAARPDLRLTVDPVEFRGYRYETGISVTVYAHLTAEEVGRGGRYEAYGGEAATGLTLYPDAVLRAVPGIASRPRVLVTDGADRAAVLRLRAEGMATVAALNAVGEAMAEARRMGCTHLLCGSEVVVVSAAATAMATGAGG